MGCENIEGSELEVDGLRGLRDVERKVPFSTVSVPLPILEEVDKLIGKVGYWPSRSAFVREACMEKIRREWRRLGRQRRGIVKVNS